ncbi:Na/Pi cotransporter family protein [Cohnella nanjingensis]|uniref:Na/Pi cotransporter family protein n=1 Tax=Cohnella nanjingensis TaxID=1387779 RepID=A0A7X0RXB5_9BACL|nr:Na/Pi symporter [Cohnella nanjingensis]MBB6675381.1 Na/Pi cotransporter family protein [Cohnella nanjingensis]
MVLTLAALSLVGMTLLLGGMKIMEAALKEWAGSRLSAAVGRLTSTPLRGFALGTVASALLQSSTAVTVLTIGLVNAGVMPFARSLGIILGTNVGTCLTTELMSLQLHRYGLPLLAAGFALWLWTALADELAVLPKLPGGLHAPFRYGGAALAGFALLLVGFAVLRTIGPLLQQEGAFQRLMTVAEQQPVWGLLGGAALTALVHSGSAVIGIAMGLASTDALSPLTGVAVVLGANVGTCVTGLIVSLGGSRGGKLVAFAQIGLNVGGALLFYPFMRELLAGAAYLAPADPAAQIAHAQTIFNLACSAIALPLAYLRLRKPSRPVYRSR